MSVRLVNGQAVDAETGDVLAGETMDTPVCQACGEPIYEWSGRGRRPSYHPHHRPASASSGPRRTGNIRNEDALRAALMERYLQIAFIAGMTNPAYRDNIRDKAAAAVDADISYAKVSPKFRRALEGMLEKTALGAVIAIHMQMFAPIVVGENLRRKAGKQQAPNPPQQTPPQTPPQPSGENVRNIRPDRPEPQPERSPEVVNAGNMPGMPA